MQDADQDETSVNETPVISKPLPSLVRTSGEVWLTNFGMSPRISEMILVIVGPRRGIAIFSELSGRTLKSNYDK